jgi:hypothetical protein
MMDLIPLWPPCPRLELDTKPPRPQVKIVMNDNEFAGVTARIPEEDL